jgi:hypothetical protein
MEGQLWIEPVGDIVIARVRGIPTVALLEEAQERIVQLVRETERGRVLYDALEMETPAVDVPLSQEKLDREIGPLKLRRAIVVPNTKLAYLARLAFGEGDYRVFYNDLTAALRWLSSESQG